MYFCTFFVLRNLVCCITHHYKVKEAHITLPVWRRLVFRLSNIFAQECVLVFFLKGIFSKLVKSFLSWTAAENFQLTAHSFTCLKPNIGLDKIIQYILSTFCSCLSVSKHSVSKTLKIGRIFWNILLLT